MMKDPMKDPIVPPQGIDPHRWAAATAALGFAPDPVAKREADKAAAREILRNPASPADLQAAAETMVGTYYHRSVEFAIKHGYAQLHPSREDYAAMVVDVNDLGLPRTVSKELRRRGAPSVTGMIDAGGLRWQPKSPR